MPRRTWRELVKYLSCRGGQKKENSNEALRPKCKEPSTQSSETNIEEQNETVREQDISILPHAEIEVEQNQGQVNVAAQLYAAEVDIHQQVGKEEDVQRKTEEHGFAATSDHAPVEAESFSTREITETEQPLTESEQQPSLVAESLKEQQIPEDTSLSLELTTLTSELNQLHRTARQLSEFPVAETGYGTEKPEQLQEPVINKDPKRYDEAKAIPVQRQRPNAAPRAALAFVASGRSKANGKEKVYRPPSKETVTRPPSKERVTQASKESPPTYWELYSKKEDLETAETSSTLNKDDLSATLTPGLPESTEYSWKKSPTASESDDEFHTAKMSDEMSKDSGSYERLREETQTSTPYEILPVENIQTKNIQTTMMKKSSLLHSNQDAGEILHTIQQRLMEGTNTRAELEHWLSLMRSLQPTDMKQAVPAPALPNIAKLSDPPMSHSISSPVISSQSVGPAVSEGDAHQRMTHLTMKGPIDDYQPVPEDIKLVIRCVAVERGVECGAIYQSPMDPKELQIIGINASSMSDDITWISSSFPEFSFSLKDCSDPRHVLEYGVDSVFDITKLVYDRGARDFQPIGEAMCGLVVVGRTKAQHPIDAHYVVVPAHLVLRGAGNDLCEDLLDGSKTVDEMREFVESKATYDRYVLGLYNSNKKNDIDSRPLFGYRHFNNRQRNRQVTWYEFTNDMALLKIEPYQIMGEPTLQPGITSEHLKYAMTKSKEFPFAIVSASFAPHYTEIEDIFPVTQRELLVEMGRRRVNVFVENDVGHMVPCGEPISTDGRNWTSAVEFITTRRFQRGHCGLIVHVQDSRPPHKLYPLGMFVGKSSRTHNCGLTVWVAVVLHQCLNEIEAEYDHLMSDLKPMERAVDRETDGQNLVPQLQQNQMVIQSSASCGQIGASAAMTDTGLGTTPGTMPYSPSHNHHLDP